ncbi:MAG: xylulokinase [Clostridiaceae bacterium]|nr:xylulokinase [Clostridiaceae bacterium]
MKYFIAHDLGTSGLKTSLFSDQGQLITSLINDYPVNFDGRRATQNPDDLLNAVKLGSKEMAKQVASEDILAMSFSAQMNACLLVDEDGKPLHDTLIWADTRAEKQASALTEKLGFDYLYELTGNRPAANYSLYKLMWLKENQPDIYHTAYKMLQPKDYVSYHLTGHMVTDHSDASGTGAYDLAKGAWSDQIIEAAGVRADLFPQIVKSIEPIGYLKPEVATELNLSPTTLVVAGGGDGPCATVGAGCIAPNQFYLTYGTSAWIGGTTDEPVLDPKKALFSFAHVIPDKFMPLGTMQAAGTSYKYIRELFEDYDVHASEYDKLAQEIKPGSNGLLFLPYLIGERSPIWDPRASGAFIGIRTTHQKAHFIRSVLEGIAFNMEWILDSFRDFTEIHDLVMTGGGAVSPVLRQIFADILDVNFIIPRNIQESTSIAAAILAGIGSGHYENFNCLERFIEFTDKTNSNQANVEIYNSFKPLFRSAYQGLKPVLSELDNLR